MEKFAVDLDKVLDELEYNEDRAENLLTPRSRRRSPSATPFLSQEHGAASLHSMPSAAFEAGDNGTKWRPKPVPIAQKTSVSGVFSSLNEYLNSGRVKTPISASDNNHVGQHPQLIEPNAIPTDLSTVDPCPEVKESQTGVSHFQPSDSLPPFPPWSPVDPGDVNTSEEKSDFMDSRIVNFSTSISVIPNEKAGDTDIHNQKSSFLPDITTARMLSNPSEDLFSSSDLISHNSIASDADSADERLADNPPATNAKLASAYPVKSVLSFDTLDLKKVLDDEELDDYLSDLELEEQEQEQLAYGALSSCELWCDDRDEKIPAVESQIGSQAASQMLISAELSGGNSLGSDLCATNLETEVVHHCDLTANNNSAFVSANETPAIDVYLGISTISNSSLETPPETVSSTVQDETPSHSMNSLSVEPKDESSEHRNPSESPEFSDISVDDELSSKPIVDQILHKLPASVEEPSEKLQKASDDRSEHAESNGTDSCTSLKNDSLMTDISNRVLDTIISDLPSSRVNCEDNSITESHADIAKAEDEVQEDESVEVTQDCVRSELNAEKRILLPLSVGETFSVPSNSFSPSTPPTVPVTPTFQDAPTLEELTSTISTSSTPFMTPTALFPESSEILEENSLEEETQCPSSASVSANDEEIPDPNKVADPSPRPVRPSSLEIPIRTAPAQSETTGSSEESPIAFDATVGPPGATPCANKPSMAEYVAEPQGTDESATESSIDEGMCGAVGGEETSADVLSEDTRLGKEPPFWVPDADAPCCMQCDFKFTVLKRRHHCRACGKVLCSKCCSDKAHLEYINAEARVCVACKSILLRAGIGSPVSPERTNMHPNPNNPMEYCSTVPPLLQVAGSSHHQTTPSVMVPVGVLKREGTSKPKSEAKQVMFSDGIRPGADLAELDGSSEPRLSIRRTGRVSKRVGTPPGNSSNSQRSLPPVDGTTMSYVPHGKGLPPIVIRGKDGLQFEEDPDPSRLMPVIQDESAPPVKFTINRNLYVLVKILNLDCCVNRVCWCFTSDGLSSVGQDEIVIILEVESNETTVPKDIFVHLNTLYTEAAKGNTVTEMGHTLTQGSPFLGSKEHGGFLYVRPTFQCLHRLILPPAPYLVGVLMHKWETPWARVFPIRLMLRLGAEFRYYPCPLVSIRQRSAVYGEIGHTIIQVLADFRNMVYTLPTVRGLVIHMEDKQTTILLPRNRYDQVMRALNNSNDHVLAFGANFSQVADSHLVCMQSDTDHTYHTQAINIHNKPRKVTGASFVVFNGALKVSCGMAAKSTIVEDGLMVKVTSETMGSLKTALRDMKDLSIACGPISGSGESANAGAGLSPSDEVVLIKWAEDDRSFNIGVLSSVDGRPLDGVPSIRVHNGTDYHGEYRFIRWTEVFILESEEGSGRTGDPVDISRLSEQLAKATCLALVKLLDLLATANLTTLAVRATIHPENVGYLAGSNGEKLPPIYMNSLDDELVPVLHQAGLLSGESPAVLELVFRIMESG